jgi:hypothetical protein
VAEASRREARPGGAAAARGADRPGDLARAFLMCWCCSGGRKPRPDRRPDDQGARKHGGRRRWPPSTLGGKALRLSGAAGHSSGRTSSTSASSTARPAPSPTIPASPRPQLRSAITYIDGDEGILLHRGYPIDQLAEHSSFMEVAYLLLNGELPSKAGARHLHLHDHAPHHAARAADRPSTAASAATRTRWRSCAAWSARCRLLPRQHRHHRSQAADDRLAPADRQDADDRGDGLQIFGRPAVHVSAERPVLHRQLPAHDLRRSGRAL